jgi:FAD/FMN-containing dehydrogenase
MRDELSRLLGAEHVLEGPALSPYNRDATARRGVEGRAEAVVLPGSAEEVAAVLRWCYAHDVPLTARGGGTGLVGGALAMEGGVVCSLERLRTVRELEPALWRMFAEAGVSTRHVQRLARENGLLFAPDPGASEQSQIGGNVATNAGGPHALKYGVTGSWVAGLEVALAPGELVQLGSWTAKDVAGYDLKSLLIGSEGTLGVITAVRLRLLPAPETAIALVVFLGTRAEGCAAIEAVFAAGVRASALEFLDGTALGVLAGGYPAEESGPVPADAGFALIAEVDGTRAEAQAQLRELKEALSGSAIAVHEPADREALWRWRDSANGVLSAARWGQGERGCGVPPRAAAGGARALRGDRGASRAELVRVRARRRRERARDGARRPHAGSRARGRGGGRAGAVRARGRPRRLGRGGAWCGLVQAGAARLAMGCGGRRGARADKAGA